MMTDVNNELPEPLRLGLREMRTARVSDESMAAALERAKQLADLPAPSRWREVGRAVIDVLAASVMLGAGLAYPVSRIDLSVERAGFSFAGLGMLEILIVLAVVAAVGVFINRRRRSSRYSSERRRWFQITLRTIVLVVTVCGVLCASAAIHYNSYIRQESARLRIEEQGWSVAKRGSGDWSVACGNAALGDEHFAALAEHLPALPSVRLRLNGSQVTDKGLEHLRGLNNLFFIDLSGTKVSDAGLPNLTSATLRSLDLTSTRVTDIGLRAISIHDLETLSLSNTQIGDRGLLQLPKSRLSTLRLSGTMVTDLGVRQIARFRRLKHLDLSNTKVTGASFRHFPASGLTVLTLDGANITDDMLLNIAHVKSLTEIHVRSTAVTDDGVQRLHERAPHIYVFR